VAEIRDLRSGAKRLHPLAFSDTVPSATPGATSVELRSDITERRWVLRRAGLTCFLPCGCVSLDHFISFLPSKQLLLPLPPPPQTCGKLLAATSPQAFCVPCAPAWGGQVGQGRPPLLRAYPCTSCWAGPATGQKARPGGGRRPCCPWPLRCSWGGPASPRAHLDAPGWRGRTTRTGPCVLLRRGRHCLCPSCGLRCGGCGDPAH
jgi:hypothetical protein